MSDVPTTMRAAVLTGTRCLELQERPVPEPGPHEVLVRVRSVGVCGSDVHYYEHGRIGSYVVERPLVLGHEVSGVVAAVGADVPADRVGERVAVEPQRPCRRCRACTSGRYNLCPRMEFFATPPVDGALCDYVVVPAEFAHPVPDELSDHAVALLEPLSVALWACGKASVGAGSRVLVTGAGPVGALVASVAGATGADEVVVTDLVEQRRDRVLALGATQAVDPREAALDGLDADALVECTGAPAALRSGLAALRPGGTAVLVGLGPADVELPVQLIASRELVLTGVFRYAGTWPAAISLARRAVDLDALVTAEHPLEDAEAALTADAAGGLKSVVVVSRG